MPVRQGGLRREGQERSGESDAARDREAKEASEAGTVEMTLGVQASACISFRLEQPANRRRARRQARRHRTGALSDFAKARREGAKATGGAAGEEGGGVKA